MSLKLGRQKTRIQVQKFNSLSSVVFRRIIEAKRALDLFLDGDWQRFLGVWSADTLSLEPSMLPGHTGGVVTLGRFLKTQTKGPRPGEER